MPCLPSASHGPSGRFDIHYTNQVVFGLTGLASAPGLGIPNNTIFSNPLGPETWLCDQFVSAPGTNPEPKALRNTFKCNLGLSHNNNPYSPIGDHTLLDIGVWNIPGYQPQNWNEGLRYHTLVGPAELTDRRGDLCNLLGRMHTRVGVIRNEPIKRKMLDFDPAVRHNHSSMSRFIEG